MAEHALTSGPAFRSSLANSAIRSEIVRLDDQSGSPRTLMKQQQEQVKARRQHQLRNMSSPMVHGSQSLHLSRESTAGASESASTEPQGMIPHSVVRAAAKRHIPRGYRTPSV